MLNERPTYGELEQLVLDQARRIRELDQFIKVLQEERWYDERESNP